MAGALITRVETEAVEVIWRGEPMIVFFTDSDGIAFVSNRDELVLVRLELLPEHEGEVPADLLRREVRQIGRHEIWDVDGGPYLPARALHLTRPLPVIEMTGEALVNIAPAERQGPVAGASGGGCLRGHRHRPLRALGTAPGAGDPARHRGGGECASGKPRDRAHARIVRGQ